MVWVPTGINTQHGTLKDNLRVLFYYKYYFKLGIIPLK